MTLTNTESKLMKLLKEIYDDKDFVCGTMTILKTDRNRSVMVDYILTAKAKGLSIESDDILKLALILKNEEQTGVNDVA